MKEITFAWRESFHLDLSMERKGMVKLFLTGVFTQPDKRVVTMSERMSRMTMRPLTGVPILCLVLYFGLYKFVGDFGAGTLVGFMEGTIFEKYFNPWITALIKGIVPWEIIQELFVGEYGVITLGFRYAVGIILPDSGHILSLFLDARRQRLFSASCFPGGPVVQDYRPHRAGGNSDGARIWLRHHGNNGDTNPRNCAGESPCHSAAGPGHTLLRTARSDTGFAPQRLPAPYSPGDFACS